MVVAALALAPLAGAQEPAPGPPAAPPAAERRGPRRAGAEEDGRVPGEAAALRARGGGDVRRAPGRRAPETADQRPPGRGGAPEPRRGRRDGRHAESRVLVRRPDGDGAGQGAQRLRHDRGPGDDRRDVRQARGRVRGRAAAGRPSLRRSLRRAHGGRDLRALPGHPPGGGRRLPPPRVLAGHDRVADLDRRGRQAAAPQAGDQLRAGAGRAAVQRRHPALEPGRQGARGALHVRGPGGRAEDRRAGDEAAARPGTPRPPETAPKGGR